MIRVFLLRWWSGLKIVTTFLPLSKNLKLWPLVWSICLVLKIPMRSLKSMTIGSEVAETAILQWWRLIEIIPFWPSTYFNLAQRTFQNSGQLPISSESSNFAYDSVWKQPVQIQIAHALHLSFEMVIFIVEKTQKWFNDIDVNLAALDSQARHLLELIVRKKDV